MQKVPAPNIDQKIFYQYLERELKTGFSGICKARKKMVYLNLFCFGFFQLHTHVSLNAFQKAGKLWLNQLNQLWSVIISVSTLFQSRNTKSLSIGSQLYLIGEFKQFYQISWLNTRAC